MQYGVLLLVEILLQVNISQRNALTLLGHIYSGVVAVQSASAFVKMCRGGRVSVLCSSTYHGIRM